MKRASDYLRNLTIDAPIDRVYDTIATIDGLRGWWTRLVTGSDHEGGKIRLEFEGMDEHIDMRVVTLRRPFEVVWSIIEHTSIDAWAGTKVHFALSPRGDQACALAFWHEGLSAKLACYEDCAAGWQHFLASLAALVEHGKGEPFAARQRRS